MKILFVCATPEEAGFSGADPDMLTGEVGRLRHFTHTIDILVTGVGMVATAYHLGRRFVKEQYDLAVNIGICGAFDQSLIGIVVNVKQDCFADFGAENNDEFIDIFQTGLMNPDQFPFTKGWLFTDDLYSNKFLKKLQEVKGISVNKTSGNEQTILKLRNKYNADVESMEGASFIYCCQMNKTPCMQIRGVSNLIEKRNKNNWQMDAAIKSLDESVKLLIEDL